MVNKPSSLSSIIIYTFSREYIPIIYSVIYSGLTYYTEREKSAARPLGSLAEMELTSS